MSGELNLLHLDDFTLLRYTACDLDDVERQRADQHLETCTACSNALHQIRELDAELRQLTRDAGLQQDLSADDPFSTRPETTSRRLSPVGRNAENQVARALLASEQACAESKRVLAASRNSAEELDSLLSCLSVSDAANRFALLYALQEAGRQIAESPVRYRALAEATLKRLGREESPPDPAAAEAEQILPVAALAGQARLLAGQACNWTGEFEKAKHHLEEAYRLFAGCTGDELSLALTEYHESQRRSFLGKGGEGLLLARRAAATFGSMGLENYVARARVAEGNALFFLGMSQEAVEAFRDAVPVFERRELWSNYVGAVNSIGQCLLKMGRLDEARREYARALRRVSRERHPALVALIRHGLAEILFSARRYREAARSFAQATRLYRDLGLMANALTASLFEIESWALSGEVARAWHRFQIFQAEVTRHDALDPSILLELQKALSGRNPDLRKVAELRQHAEEFLRERLKRESR